MDPLSTKYDEALKAIQDRELLLFAIAHELRNPISAHQMQISLITKIIREETKSCPNLKKLEGLIEAANAQLRDVSNLIDRLFETAYISTGQLTLKKEKTELSKFLTNIIESFQTQCQASSRDQIHLSSSGEIICELDQIRMKQVILNLLSNAVKFGQGKPIYCSTSPTQDGIQIEVQDQGIGIPKHFQEKIFDRFQRCSGSQGSIGLGLGLYIAKELVRAHGGTIQVNSEPGTGAKFIVCLPCPSNNLEGHKP